ncbi:MAG: hypothetical protein COW84_04950 [Gammaproteobacteria bacterium CG22_combo_CG10-13_8_21_14_all_40_8]|nr:MAG: hypothetical protein COW84_04950 [Gammaproteobacteria bacterium CG22_combo_CG10-13_8_21_14_all_40_8]
MKNLFSNVWMSHSHVYKTISESGLFDEQFYKTVYSGFFPFNDCLMHYIAIGANKFYDPSQYFSTSFYFSKNIDVRKSGVNPLYHYIVYGEVEGREPNPYFKPSLYLKLNPDLAGWSKTLLCHFANFGHKEFREYDTTIKRNTLKESISKRMQVDISKEQSIKVVDEEKEIFQKRLIVPMSQEDVDKAAKIISESNFFDEKFYKSQLTDEYLGEEDSWIVHYLKHGWSRGLNPNNWFDVKNYLDAHDDISNANLEPFSHYIAHGQYENRPLSGYKYEKIVEEKKYFDLEEHELAIFNAKVIAFYLPQFHPFKENDEWWGKGFTEWSNVAKAKPNFRDHYQPHIPTHLGFYDLRLPEVMKEQSNLAKNYGINGFNFYYYWFDGRVLMEKPFEILLGNKDIDIEFCITWANENWTRTWDGLENDVLIAQNHSLEDSAKFLKSLYEYFDDERYIRINNKPVLIIYRVDIIPDILTHVKLWREMAVQAGYDGIYLICSQTFGIKSPEKYGFDAAMEFPPHTTTAIPINDKLKEIRDEFEGVIYNYSEVVKNACIRSEPDYKLFRTCMLSWDNTARKQDKSVIFANFSLVKYKEWLENNVSNVINNDKYIHDEKLIFINAWNEWAEGTHLEPDREYGYGYLQATYDVLEKTAKKKADCKSGLDVLVLAVGEDVGSLGVLYKQLSWFYEKTFLKIGVCFSQKTNDTRRFTNLFDVTYCDDFGTGDYLRLKLNYKNKIKSIYVHSMTDYMFLDELKSLSIPIILNLDYSADSVQLNDGISLISSIFKSNRVRNIHMIDPKSFELSLLEFLYNYTELKPKVSVVIPSYNHSKFLPQRLDSVLEQSFQDFELILLDDASKDESAIILKEYTHKRPSTFFEQNTINGGTPFTQWAKGIEKSRANIIWIAEDDDFCKNTFLERLVPSFNNSRVKLAYTNSNLVDEKGEFIAEYESIFASVSSNKWTKDYTMPAYKEIQTSLGIRNTIPNASATLFRKFDIEPIIEKLKQFKFAGDWYFYLKCLAEGDIAYVSDKLNYHRRHSTSTMALLNSDTQLYFKEIEEIHKFVLGEYILNEWTVSKMSNYITDEWKSKAIEGELKNYYDIEVFSEGRVKYNRSYNIAVFFSGYYFGGAEIFPINLANSFAELGHNTFLVNVGALDTDVRVEAMVSSLVNKVDFPNCENTKMFLSQFILDNNIDYINSQGWFATDFIQKNINVDQNVPWFVSMHGHEENIIEGAWGDCYLQYFENAFRNTVRLAPTFIYTHSKNLQALEHLNVIDSSDLVCLPTLGMPNHLPESNLKSELNIDSDSFVVGFVGRGIEEKGWLEAIQAVILLREKNHLKVDLIMIGDSDYVQDLKKSYSQCYLHYLGLSDEVLSWGQVFDVSVLPTYYKSESHPLVIMGYLLCGNPVITTSLGNIPEMISFNGKNAGYLLDLNNCGKTDPRGIANHIKKYIDDPTIFDEHQSLARKTYRKFDMALSAKSYIKTFEQRIIKRDHKLNSKKNLYLHIGQPKTGTSAIQMFLVNNSRVLEKDFDLFYPDFGRWCDGSHHEIAFTLGDNPYRKMKSDDEQIQFMNELMIEIDKTKCNNILLSSECFHLYNNANFKKIFSECFNIKIICYLRRQDLFVESIFGQNVRDIVFKEKKSFGEFVKSKEESLFYLRELEKWEVLARPENFFVRVYEPSKFVRNDVVADFCSIFDINSDSDRFVKNEKNINSSYSRNVSEYKHILNHFYEKQSNKLLYILELYSRVELDEDQEINRLSFFDDDSRSEFIKRFKSNNELVHKKYGVGSSFLFDNTVNKTKSTYSGLEYSKILSITQYIFQKDKDIFEEILICLDADIMKANNSPMLASIKKAFEVVNSEQS